MAQHPPAPPAEYHYPIPPWPADIINGIVLGDYARRLGIPGRITQAALGFVPVVGSLCAFRDFFACRQKKQTIGAILNGLAIIPFFGGFPKTAAAINALRDVGNFVITGNATYQEFKTQQIERAAMSGGHVGATPPSTTPGHIPPSV